MSQRLVVADNALGHALRAKHFFEQRPKRRLNTTPPTVRAMLARGELKGRQLARGSRVAWLIDEASIAAYLASHGPFGGRRRVAVDRMTALERDVAALRVAIESTGPGPEKFGRLHRERDDLRATVTTLQDALARMRAVAELQRQADVERAEMVDHLLAAIAAGERADALRRSAPVGVALRDPMCVDRRVY